MGGVVGIPILKLWGGCEDHWWRLVVGLSWGERKEKKRRLTVGLSWGKRKEKKEEDDQ